MEYGKIASEAILSSSQGEVVLAEDDRYRGLRK